MSERPPSGPPPERGPANSHERHYTRSDVISSFNTTLNLYGEYLRNSPDPLKRKLFELTLHAKEQSLEKGLDTYDVSFTGNDGKRYRQKEHLPVEDLTQFLYERIHSSELPPQQETQYNKLFWTLVDNCEPYDSVPKRRATHEKRLAKVDQIARQIRKEVDSTEFPGYANPALAKAHLLLNRRHELIIPPVGSEVIVKGKKKTVVKPNHRPRTTQVTPPESLAREVIPAPYSFPQEKIEGGSILNPVELKRQEIPSEHKLPHELIESDTPNSQSPLPRQVIDTDTAQQPISLPREEIESGPRLTPITLPRQEIEGGPVLKPIELRREVIDSDIPSVLPSPPHPALRREEIPTDISTSIARTPLPREEIDSDITPPGVPTPTPPPSPAPPIPAPAETVPTIASETPEPESEPSSTPPPVSEVRDNYEICIINRTEDMRKRAAELADERLRKEMQENAGWNPKKWFKRIKLRAGEEYLRQKYIEQTVAAMKEHNNSFLTMDFARGQAADTTHKKAEEQESGLAKIEQVRSGIALKGQELKVASGPLKEAMMRELIMPVVNRNITDEKAFQDRLRDFVRENIDKPEYADLKLLFGTDATKYGRMAEYVATDLFGAAEMIRRDRTAHTFSLQELDHLVTLQLANSSWAAETEAHFNLVDKAVAWAQRGKHRGKILNPTVMGAAASVATFAGTRAFSNLARSKAVNYGMVPGVGAAVGGVMAAAYRSKELSRDRASEQVDTAYNKDTPLGAKRREALTKYHYDAASASALLEGNANRRTVGGDTRGIRELLATDVTLSDPDTIAEHTANRDALLRRMAEITTRLDFSVEHKVDLIHFHGREHVEQDRMQLVKAVAEGKIKLRHAGMNDTEITDALTRFGSEWKQQFIENKEQQDREFRNYRLKQSAKAFGIAFASGFVGSFVAQEEVAVGMRGIGYGLRVPAEGLHAIARSVPTSPQAQPNLETLTSSLHDSGTLKGQLIDQYGNAISFTRNRTTTSNFLTQLNQPTLGSENTPSVLTSVQEKIFQPLSTPDTAALGQNTQTVLENTATRLDHLATTIGSLSARETLLEKAAHSVTNRTALHQVLPTPEVSDLNKWKAIYNGGQMQLDGSHTAIVGPGHVVTIVDAQANVLSTPRILETPSGSLIVQGNPLDLPLSLQKDMINWQVAASPSELHQQLMAFAGPGKNGTIEIGGQQIQVIDGKFWPPQTHGDVMGVIQADGSVNFQGNDLAMEQLQSSLKSLGFDTGTIQYDSTPILHNEITEFIQNATNPDIAQKYPGGIITSPDGTIQAHVFTDGSHRIVLTDLTQPNRPPIEGSFYTDIETVRTTTPAVYPGTNIPIDNHGPRGELINFKFNQADVPENSPLMQELKQAGFTYTTTPDHTQWIIAPADVNGNSQMHATAPGAWELIPPLPKEPPAPATPFWDVYPLEPLIELGYYSERFNPSHTMADIMRRGRVRPRGSRTVTSPGALTEFTSVSRAEGERTLAEIHERFTNSNHVYITLAGAIGDAAITSAYVDGIRRYAEQTGTQKQITLIVPPQLHEMLQPTATAYGYELIGAERYQCVDKARELIAAADETRSMVFDFDFTTENGPNPIYEETPEGNVIVHELFASGIGLYKNDRAGRRRYEAYLGDLLNIPERDRLPVQPHLLLPTDSSRIYTEMRDRYHIDEAKTQIGLVIEGSGAFKRFDLEKWREVIATAASQEREINIIYNGDPGTRNYTEDQLRAVFGTLPNVRYISPSLQESMVLLQKQNLVLANDTGLAHIAAIVENGPKVISLHGLDLTPNTWVSNTDRHIGIWSGREDLDVNTIAPSKVSQEVQRQLASIEASRPIQSSTSAASTPITPSVAPSPTPTPAAPSPTSPSPAVPMPVSLPPLDTNASAPVAPIVSSTASTLPAPGIATRAETLASTATVSISTGEATTEIGNVALDLQSLKEFADRTVVEKKETYEKSLHAVIDILEKSDGIAELKDLPTIIIPDLHARKEFLIKALERELTDGPYKGQKVYDLLKQGKINFVCLGDGMHSEVSSNWILAKSVIQSDGTPKVTEWGKMYREASEAWDELFEKINGRTPFGDDERRVAINAFQKTTDPAYAEIRDRFNKMYSEKMTELMKAEISRSLGLMKMVMDLKTEFPDAFHYIRGNHDDMNEVMNRFYKFANESKDVKEWITQNFGNDFLQRWTYFESLLPLMVKGKGFVATHAAPNDGYSEDAIRSRDSLVAEGLTWTNNIDMKPEEITRNILDTEHELRLSPRTFWIIGHRVVSEHDGRYREVVPGKMYQINNDKKYIFAYIPNDRRFSPDIDTSIL